MKLTALTDLYSINPPASEPGIRALELAMGKVFPAEYRDLLLAADGFMLGSGVGVYGTQEVEERNATFEVASYAPGYLAIGDDSGGRAIMMREGDPGVFVVHQGVMAADAMTFLAATLTEWINQGGEV